MPAAKKKHQIHHIVLQQTRSPLFYIIIAFVLGFGTHFLISVIFAESKIEESIHSCVNKVSGEVRIISNYTDYRDGKLEKIRKDNKEDTDGCRENEMALQWNKQGPPGPTGGSSFPFICPECSIGNIGNRLAGKDLSNAILSRASLDNADLNSVNFQNALLIATDFTNSNLSNVNFENADLSEARFENANLTGTKWKNTICPDGTNSNNNNNTCEGHIPPSEE
jgi:hypothetical protein